MAEGGDKLDLATLRARVRDVDERLYQLMAERQELARQIGAAKAACGLPVKDYKVEKDVTERSRARARELGLYEDMAEEASQLLIKYAVMVQDEYRQRKNRAHAGAARRILIAGGRGRMGRWLTEFFESFGHAVRHFDPHAEATGPEPLVADLAAGAADSDVVVLSTPIQATPALLRVLTAAGTKALVFDVCSLKTPLLAALQEAAAKGLRVASVHPMFGPSVDVLSGRNILLCDTGDAASLAEARALFEGTTATLLTLPLARHDELMSYVLGLSHLTSLVFADVLRRSGAQLPELAAAASTTFHAQLGVSVPVLHENQDLYYEIQAANSCTGDLLQAFRASLEAYAAAITAADREAFRKLMAAGRHFLDAPAP